MATTVFTGWRTVTPGRCNDCGERDAWECDGRGNVLCACQACADCGMLDAYGFHEHGCPQIARNAEQYDEDEPYFDGGRRSDVAGRL